MTHNKDEFLSIFGNRIKELRQQNNMTQAELAEKLGFSNNYVGMIERGERSTGIINIPMFAKCFNISVEELFKSM